MKKVQSRSRIYCILLASLFMILLMNNGLINVFGKTTGVGGVFKFVHTFPDNTRQPLSDW